MKRTLSAIVVLILISSSANAALLSRAGGQAYYDTDLNITWLADANLAATNTFGVPVCTSFLTLDSGCIAANDHGNYAGQMTWGTAQTWIAAMNTANYLGVSHWRLPTVTDTGVPGCDYAYSGTDCGFSTDLATGEMAHLFYSTLGNTAGWNTSGVKQPCAYAGPSYCLTNPGPFSNPQSLYYWSGTEYAPDSSSAWVYYLDFGDQRYTFKRNPGDVAWAVAPGDIAAVPLPPAAFLFPSALGLLGWVRRKR